MFVPGRFLVGFFHLKFENTEIIKRNSLVETWGKVLATSRYADDANLSEHLIHVSKQLFANYVPSLAIGC